MTDPRNIDPGSGGNGPSLNTNVSTNGIDITATYSSGDSGIAANINFNLRSGALQRFSLSVFNGSSRLTQNFDFAANSFGQTFSHDFGNGISGSVLWQIGQMDTVQGTITFRFEL